MIIGVAGTATLATDGLSATFVSAAAFDHATTYDLRMEVCADRASSTFTTDSCDNEVEEVFPLDGATDALYRTDIVARLDDPDPGAYITVDGVVGTTFVSGEVVVFQPDDPLDSGTTYDATVTYACSSESWSFTTSDVGAPTSTSPEGEVFSLDLTTGTFIEPGGSDIGLLIGDLFGDTELLLSVTDPPTTVIPMIGALGDGNGVQDVCVESIDIPDDPSYDDPYFQLEVDALPVSAISSPLTLDDVTLSGAFTADLAAIEGGVLQAELDSRSLFEVLGLPSSAPDDSVCLLFSAVGVSCEACSDGSGTYCLPVWIADLEAPNVGGTIVEIDAATAAANCP